MISWLSGGEFHDGWTSSNYAGHGILFQNLPTEGDQGGSPLLDDGGINGDEVRWGPPTVTSGSITVKLYEDGSFESTGGAGSFTYPWWRNGTDEGVEQVNIETDAQEALSGAFDSDNTQASNFSGSVVELTSSDFTSANVQVSTFSGSATELSAVSFTSNNIQVSSFSGSAVEYAQSGFTSSNTIILSLGGAKAVSVSVESISNAQATFSGSKTEDGVLSGTFTSSNVASSSFSGSKVEISVASGTFESTQAATANFSGSKEEQELTGSVFLSLQAAVSNFSGSKVENEVRRSTIESLQSAVASFSGHKSAKVSLQSDNGSEAAVEGFKAVSVGIISSVVGASSFVGYNLSLPPAKVNIVMNTSSDLYIELYTNQNLELSVNSFSQLEVE